MQNSRRGAPTNEVDPALPAPRPGSRWRWASTRGALVGGGILAAALTMGSVTAGATTPPRTKAPMGAAGAPRSGMARPTAMGKISALSGDDITIEGHGSTTQTVVYSASTTFRDSSGSTTAADLKVGESISVTGSKASDGTVTATSIMIGMGNRPPGGGTRPSGGPGGRAPGGQGGPPKGTAPSA
jgi:uncharacterized protein DUF5666